MATEKVVSGDDDIWDEECRDADTFLAQKNWNQLKDNRTREGYREGVSVGKDMLLQDGFNAGYQKATLIARRLGRLRGRLSAQLALCHQIDEGKLQPSSEINHSITSDINKLIVKISQVEKQIPSVFLEEHLKVTTSELRFETESDTATQDKTIPASSSSRIVDGSCCGSDDSCCQRVNERASCQNQLSHSATESSHSLDKLYEELAVQTSEILSSCENYR